MQQYFRVVAWYKFCTMHIVFIVIKLQCASTSKSSCIRRQIFMELYLMPITNNFTVESAPSVEPTTEYAMVSPNAGLLPNNEDLPITKSNMTVNVKKSATYTCRACNAVDCGEKYINVTIKRISYFICHISLCIRRVRWRAIISKARFRLTQYAYEKRTCIMICT